MAASLDQNFYMSVGEDRTLTFAVTDGDGNNIDLTGGSVSFVVRSHPLSATTVLTIAGSSLADGSFAVVIADTDTDAINPGVYYHESKFTDTGSFETVVARGWMQLDPAVT